MAGERGDIHQDIVAAIQAQQVPAILYEGDAEERCIEPHTYGRGSEFRLLLRAFQVSGPSESGKPQGWKLFRVEDILSPRLLSQTFPVARPGYRRGDRVMTQEIFAQL